MTINQYMELNLGRILIAQPFMQEMPFSRSVILLTDYSPLEGGVGFILNRPLKMNVDRLISDFPDFEGQAYYGGPVQTDVIHYVHSVGDLLKDSTSIGNGMYWGGHFEKLKALIRQGLISSSQVQFYVGYSGWSPGQLEQEVAEGSWIIGRSNRNYLFNTAPDKLWNRAMINQGDVYSVLAQIPDNVTPHLN